MPATIFGNAAAALGLYQAFYGKAPAYATFTNNVALAAQSGTGALASAFGANFASTAPAALTTSVLANLGISNATLATALTQVFTAYPAAARGQIVLNLVNILSTLEGDAVYGASATAFNNQIASNNSYSTNSANTADSAGGATLTSGTDTLTSSVFNAGLVYTPGGNDRVNSLQDEDTLTGINTDTTDSILNAVLGNANDNGGTIITPRLIDVRDLSFTFSGSSNAGTVSNNAVQAVDLQDSTGVTSIDINRVSQAVNNARIENIKQVVADLGIHNTNANNTGTVEFSYGAGTLLGNNSVNLAIDNVQVGTVNIGLNTSGVAAAGVGNQGYETVNLSSVGASNSIGSLNLPMDTGTAGAVVITGDKNLTLATRVNVVNAVGTVESVNYSNGILQANGRLASVDASGLNAALTLNIQNGLLSTGKADTSGTVQNVTITGSKFDDTFILQDTVQAGDSLTGGDGTDTLIVANGGTINSLSSAITKIEKVEVRVDSGAAAGGATVDFAKVTDATSILLHNEASNQAAAPGPAAPVGSGVVTYTLNNLTAPLAAALTVNHSNTGSNGITQNVITANLANAAGTTDLVGLTIAEGLNTDPRFNATLITHTGAGLTGGVESVTLTDSDSESNTIALASVAQHTGTITLTGGQANTFLNLDTTTAGANGGMYQYNVAGGTDANSSAAGATVGRIADLSGTAAQVRLVAGTINAGAETANVVARVSSSVAATSAVGAQNITLGSGNDTVIFDNLADTRAGLTISDTVTGGAGNDTLAIDGNVAITLGASEWTNVSGFETLRVIGNGVAANNGATATNSYNLTLTNELLSRNKDANGFLNVVSDNDLFNDTGRTVAQAAAATVVDANGVATAVANDAGLSSGGVTIDGRGLSAGSKWTFNGNEGAGRSADRIILSDANIDGNAVIDGGAIDNITNNSGIASTNGTTVVGNATAANTGNADVIEVRNSAVVSQGDLANIRNIGTLSFTNDLAIAQASTLQLNDAIVDNMVDSYQASASRAQAATLTVGGANVEVLQINAVDNMNVAAATTGLTIEAGSLTDKSDLSITLGRGANVVTTGAGNDSVVLLGNYAAGAYGAGVSVNGVFVNAQANGVAGARAVTDNINLGTGVDTLVTYGNINLAGATLTGVENLVSNSQVTLTETQFRALTSLRFTATGPHTLTITNDGSVGAIDLTKVTSDGSVLNITNNSGDTLSGATSNVNGGTTVLAAGGALSVTMAQAIANDYRSNDPVTVLDTGANIATALANGSVALNDTAQAGEVDFFDASDNVLNISVASATTATNGRLTAADVVTLADTGATLASVAGLTAAAFANVDFVDATDNALALTVSQLATITNAKLTAADLVTLADTGANLNGVSASSFTGLTNVDKVDATDNAVTFSAAQVAAATNAKLTTGDTVTLADTAANIQAIAAGTFTGYTDVDAYDSTDNVLSVSTAQASAIGNKFTAVDVVTIADTGANLAANVGGLGSNYTGFATLSNTDVLDASDNAVSLTLAQLASVAAGGPLFAANDVMTFAMTTGADTIAALGGAHVGGNGGAGVEVLRYTASNQAGSAAFTDVATATALANTDTFALTLPDLVTGFTAGQDKVNLAAFNLTGVSAVTQFTASGSKVGDSEYAVIRGAYAGGTFTANTAGADTLVVWDGNTAAGSVTMVSVVLVGTVATAADLTLA